MGIADLAFELTGLAVITVKIGLRGRAGRAKTVFRDVAFLTSGDGFYLDLVSVFKVRDEELPVPFMLDEVNLREFIHFELLIFRGMGVIKSPLPEGNISADKANQPAVLLIKVLNNRE